MKVLIFSGGTGSISLQAGFAHYFDNLIDVQVLTNAYDNGKSTGLVRQVFDGKILGPSDLRKNQMTKFINMNKIGNQHLNDTIINAINFRFTDTAENAKKTCLHVVNTTKWFEPEDPKIMAEAIEHFFAQPKAKHIKYHDFSWANIVYAGLAALNGNSLSVAGKIMAKILRIPGDAVILNDDESLFLRAVTKSGQHILDEGEIVEWNNPNDKISSIYFVDANNNSRRPKLSDEAVNAIYDADIIIFSAGTQWTSLIPTYLSQSVRKPHTLYDVDKSFYDHILDCKAKKFLVINNEPDYDMLGWDVNELLNILQKYLPLDHITRVFNINADHNMTLERVNKQPDGSIAHSDLYREFKLSNVGERTHTDVLAIAIMIMYYEVYMNNRVIVFDYDDTLVGRNNEYENLSAFNMAAISGMNASNFCVGKNSNLKDKDIRIFTGNTIKALDFASVLNKDSVHITTKHKWIDGNRRNACYEKPLKVYADGGVNLYIVTTTAKVWFDMCIEPTSIFTNDEINNILTKITYAGIPTQKVQTRHKVMVSIKPIDDEYRVPVCKLLQLFLPDYVVRKSGRSTIDISKITNSKLCSLKHVIIDANLAPGERITYVGDESHEGGNDFILKNNQYIDYLHVNNPRDTSLFLYMLLKLYPL